MDNKEILTLSLSYAVEANKKATKKEELLGLHDLYDDTVKMAEQIKVHAVKGVFPEELFAHRSPNETEAEATYIRENYKQITFPIFVDYISTICRPMGDGNWGIDYKEDASEFKQNDLSFQKYVESELPVYGSLENFIKYILPSIKSIDANGFIAIRPKELPIKLDEEGQRVIDSTRLYEPTIFYYESKKVIAYEHHEYYMFLSNERSLVNYGGREVREGKIYELYTKDAVYFVIQEGLKTENKFRIELFYQHDLGYCPVKQLAGIPHLKNDKILYQSPFLYSVDLLDLVATNGNWEQAMINSCVFPVKVMFGSKCEFRDSHGRLCQEGKITIEGVEKTCPSCHGQGLKSRISPLGTLLINPSTKFEQGEEKSTVDPLKYVSPEVHTLEFVHKKVESDTMKARAILHLRNKNTSVVTNDGVMTATEVFDDAKSMYAFIKPISDQIFNIYEFCLNTIGKQRYGESFEAPSLSYPKTFDFKSAEDYLNDISNAIKNNMPPSFIQIILMQYINAFFGDNEKTNKIFKLVATADKLFGLSQDEISVKIARGTAGKWQDILHTSVLNFINDAILADKDFIEKPIEKQVEILTDMAKKMETEIQSKPIEDITKTMLPDTGGGV